MARTDGDPILLAPAAEGRALELFGAVDDERPGTAEHRPAMVGPSPRAPSHSSFGQSAWARQSATELGFSIVRQNPRIAREKTSTTIVR